MEIMFGLVVASLAIGAEPVRLEATRDTWVSGVGAEADGGNGGAGKLKFKSYQELSLIDFDMAPLKGRTIARATLHLKSAGEPRLKRVTVGTVGAEWSEGTAANYEPQAGNSTFRMRKHPDVPWTDDGGDICRVILGSGGTTWGMGDASPPDAEGWQAIPIDPRVVATRAAGVGFGFVVFDDTGSEWTRDGERFDRHPFPNRFAFSRESNRSRAPYLTVELGALDAVSPEAPADLRCDPADLPAGEAWVSWTSPADRGAGVVGFFAKIGEDEIERSKIPAATKPGERVRMKVRDTKAHDKPPNVSVRAVDGAGNLGPWAKVLLVASVRSPKPLPAPAPTVEGRPNVVNIVVGGSYPLLGTADVVVIDELDKLPPNGDAMIPPQHGRGAMIPPQPAGYLGGNHLWDARSREIRLHAARNEFVAFQVVVTGSLQVVNTGPVKGLSARLEFEGDAKTAPKVEFGVYRNVAAKGGPLPDPIVPLRKPIDLPGPGLRSGSLHVEIYIPHDAPAGVLKGKLILQGQGVEPLVLPVSLKVWDFTLPDSLSFLPEMNSYGLPDDEKEYYRLAHRHRVVLNRLTYSHNGKVQDGCAPKWDGKTLDWSAWDKRFGPYLDGSAFADLPRKGVPIEIFYLPLHENWPAPIEPNYNGDYWADRAFTDRYRRELVEVTRQFAAHFHAKKWDGTLFEAFLNNKVDYKAQGWSHATSPWLLDEPASFQDFWALRYFGSAFHEGFRKAGDGPARMVFRCDISRPQWQRDSLDGVLDVNVVGGAMRQYRPEVLGRKEQFGQVVEEYGTANPVEGSNLQPAAWCLDAWTLGMDGVVPWQTIGNEGSWSKADELSLFYPARDGNGPVPSARLKAFRRGQQDVEYLTLWAKAAGEPRWAVASRAREALTFDARRQVGGGEDAGQVVYDRLTPRDLWALRTRLGEAISALRPPPSRKLVDFRTPRRDPSALTPKLVP